MLFCYSLKSGIPPPPPPPPTPLYVRWLVASLCPFSLTLSGFGVLQLIPNTCQIDRLLREAFRFGYVQHETSIQQVVKDWDLSLRKRSVGTPSHPL